MAQPHRAMWLPPALLLLWVPGCFSLSGPRKVRGIVGGSLSVECRYREEFINNSKYWCKPPCVLLWKMAETTKSEREVTRDRMSIRDHPANLTFTVTLKSLREEDAGTYRCGINVPFNIDPIFEIEVSVIPAPAAPPTPRPTRLTVPAETSTITTKVSTVSFTTLTTEGTTHNASSQEEYDPTQNWRLHELLIWLVLLLLLLGGISLLAWRMVQRRVKVAPREPVVQPFSSELRLKEKIRRPQHPVWCSLERNQSRPRAAVRLLSRLSPAMQIWSCRRGPLLESPFNPRRRRWNTAQWARPAAIFTTPR
ncbi:CMRF35-like molecule 8 isoform X7 [Bubalus bubalis]|uniref:CMRF35-like molecule 8 isoform X7 n=1 Tax=Bubalus bubalis TaxID=89462 RepID=UPI001D12C42C|nr:CMRF35-like molecule 8 isoform X7 [Bubalus bubalis]